MPVFLHGAMNNCLRCDEIHQKLIVCSCLNNAPFWLPCQIAFEILSEECHILVNWMAVWANWRAILTVRLEHPRPRGLVWGSDRANRGLV